MCDKKKVKPGTIKRCSRRKFLKAFTITAGGIIAGVSGFSCDDTKSNSNPNNNNKNEEPTLYSIPDNDGDVLNYPGENMMVVRLDNKVFAVSSVCTHQKCIVEYNSDKNIFICPCHQASYEINGKKLTGIQPRNLDRFFIKKVGVSKVLVDTNKRYKEGSTEYKDLYIDL